MAKEGVFYYWPKYSYKNEQKYHLMP